MGYDIYIGNGEMEQEDDDDEIVTPYSRIINGKVCYFRMRVRNVELSEAPTFPNDRRSERNSNYIGASYIWWDHFCYITGIHPLFFDRYHGLMREHPGFVILRDHHAEAIKNALACWKKDHPNATPGFEAFSWGEEVKKVGYDPVLAQLIKLDFLVQWALKHCEHAGIYNF